MAGFVDGYWWNDGLRLHYRDYAGGTDGRPPILCLPGLTRNARDFEALAETLAPEWRVITVDFRGRGESAYSKNPTSYAPLIYVLDLQALIRELNLEAFIAIGTSLGGLVTMLMAGAERDKIRAVVLNDIAPQVEAAGIDRIRGYVGRGGSWPTWLHAARALAENNRVVFPDYRIEDWLRMAKRLYRLSSNGRVVNDYDTRIAEPMRTAAEQPEVDLWPALEALKDKPALILRGELSDVISPSTVARMNAAMPLAEAVTVPRVGHAPTLDEPVALQAIARLLEKVSSRPDKKGPAGEGVGSPAGR
jgi:pimeloyl-ACP methyl ester carboxylesterase